jgi:hypothetical protein
MQTQQKGEKFNHDLSTTFKNILILSLATKKFKYTNLFQLIKFYALYYIFYYHNFLHFILKIVRDFFYYIKS